MSLITRYELSPTKLIPLKVHLGADIAAGFLLAASPWLLGFAEVIWWPHLPSRMVPLLEQVGQADTDDGLEADQGNESKPASN